MIQPADQLSEPGGTLPTLVHLEEPYQILQQEAREVAQRLEPIAVEADSTSNLHPGVMEILRSSRLLDLIVPAKYGGRFEQVDPVAVCVVREALMSVCSAADTAFALQGIGSYAITAAGSLEQRTTWLPRVASGEVLAALALTEPDAGSDLRAITTTIRERAGTLVISGEKAFISNASVAGFFVVLAREDASQALSAVLVPSDRPGVSVGPAPELIAPHVIGNVTFHDVELPETARLGDAGEGLAHVLSTLAVFRVSVAAAAVGLAQTALDEAVRHTSERHAFGKPLARLGPVAGHLADSWADVASVRLLTYEAARLAREDPLANLEYSSLAKLAATEACARVVDRCVQVMGRWGLISNSRIERCYRQARPMRIYEGASDVLKLGIARRLCSEIEQ